MGKIDRRNDRITENRRKRGRMDGEKEEAKKQRVCEEG